MIGRLEILMRYVFLCTSVVVVVMTFWGGGGGWVGGELINIDFSFLYTASESFLHTSGVVRSTYIWGAPPGGDWAGIWHWTKRFTIFFSNRKQ